MSIETRHTEKNILFKLLRIKDIEDLQEVIANLIATMEPEDVELVKKQVADIQAKR